MENVFEYLNKIQELLEQIDGITQNQTTILIGMQKNLDEEHTALGLIEEMVSCKDVIITALIEVEQNFQYAYDLHRESLIKSGRIKSLKVQVERVLQMKGEITKREEQNMLLLQNQSQKKIECVKVPPNSNQVTAAYKKQQIKT